MLSAIVLAACSTEMTTAPLSTNIQRANHTGDATGGYIRVCKESGPVGAYTFSIDVQGGGEYALNYGPQATVNFPGELACEPLYGQQNLASWDGDKTAMVTVAELVPEGMSVAEIKVFNPDLGHINGGYLYSVHNVRSITLAVGALDKIKLHFVNIVTPPQPPPPSGNGCTPGYWKQSQHFDSWESTGLVPTQTIASVFANASIHGLGNNTLVEGLGFDGGGGLVGAAKILLRAAIAAQLNARHENVGAPVAADAMITSVNDALASGSRAAMLELASELDKNNNLGCALN